MIFMLHTIEEAIRQCVYILFRTYLKIVTTNNVYFLKYNK